MNQWVKSVEYWIVIDCPQTLVSVIVIVRLVEIGGGIIGRALVLIVNILFVNMELEFVTCTIKLLVCTVVGVPEMRPFEFKDNPKGRTFELVASDQT